MGGPVLAVGVAPLRLDQFLWSCVPWVHEQKLASKLQSKFCPVVAVGRERNSSDEKNIRFTDGAFGSKYQICRWGFGGEHIRFTGRAFGSKNQIFRWGFG